jgi:FG-GAP-like repeat
MPKARLILAAVLLGAWGLGAQQSAPRRITTLPVGGGALAIGDVNHDGRQDIVTARADGATVFLGDGRGRFAQAAGSPFAAGSNPSDLALGDFDADGRLDVAVANHETSYSTLLMGNGRGGLAAPIQTPVPSRPHPHGVAAGDFNGDRHLDLAIESWDENAVLVFHGDGKGAFSREPLRLAVGRVPYYKLRAGDLNADARDDLVTTNSQGSSVSVLCTDQSGALQAAREIATTRSPFAVAIGDVNGDRRADLAVAHRWGGVDPDRDALTVLIGRGDCEFAPSPESPMKAGASPTDVAIGDFDADGIGDIATANMGSHDVTLFLGGRTGLRPAMGSPFSVGKGPVAVLLRDLNGDGKAEIVTGNNASNDLSVIVSP